MEAQKLNDGSQPALQQTDVMRSLITSDGINVPIGKYVFYVGGTIISPKPQKRCWRHLKTKLSTVNKIKYEKEN